MREITNNVQLTSQSGRPQNTNATVYALKRRVDGLAQSDPAASILTGSISVRSSTTDDLAQGSDNLYLTPQTLQQVLNGQPSNAYGGIYVDLVNKGPGFDPNDGSLVDDPTNPPLDIAVAGAENTQIGLGRSNTTNFANVISYVPPGGSNPVPMINFASTLGGPSWIIQGGTNQANFYINIREDQGNDNIYSLFYVDRFGNPTINGRKTGVNTPHIAFNTGTLQTPNLYQVHFEEDSGVGEFHVAKKGVAATETRLVLYDSNGNAHEVYVDTSGNVQVA